MTGGRRRGMRIALAALLMVLAVSGAALAAGRRPGSVDPTFGKGGHVVVSLPSSLSPSWFGPIAPAAGGRLLVVYNDWATADSYTAVIERREPDGAPDPSFGRGGSVRVRGSVTALAEDPSGGVIYAGVGVGRLRPDGSKDKAFDGRHPAGGNFVAVKVAFDAAGRILVGGKASTGARYHPHDGQSAIMRLDPDGRRDPSFGSGGFRWLGQELVSHSLGGEFDLLPDGSILILGTAVEHLSADGTVLPTPKIVEEEEQPSSLVVFPDGSFATASSPLFAPGCTVVRYRADGSPDPAFAQGGTFSDPGLTDCHLQPAPGGGLLVRAVVGPNKYEGTPELLLLTGAGVPAAGFGNGGEVSVPLRTGAAPGEAWSVQGVAFSSAGDIIVAGGGGISVDQVGAAALLRLTANGAVDPAFGSGGSVVRSSSPPSWTEARAATALPGGELIVTGFTDSGNLRQHPFWMRFGPDGKAIPTTSGALYKLISRPPSKLLPAGRGRVYGLIDDLGPAIVKLKAGGAAAAGFGDHGQAHLPSGFAASSFVVDADGGVTVLGSEGPRSDMAAYRFTAAGRPDRSFGRQGLSTVRFPSAEGGRAQAGVARADGGVLLLGKARGRFVAALLGADGRLRRDFGRRGIVSCRCGGVRPGMVAAAGRRGAVYVLDHGVTGRGERTDLIKIAANGHLDRAFAGRGWKPVQIGGSSIALFVRGERLLAVGQRGYFTGASTVRAFYLDGAPDRSYKPGAAVLAGEGSSGASRLAALMQADGRLVLVGEQRSKSGGEFGHLAMLGLR